MTDKTTPQNEPLEIAPDPVVDTIPQDAPPPVEARTDDPPAPKEPNRVHMSPQDKARMEIASRFRQQREDPDAVDYHGDHNDPTQHYGHVAAPEDAKPEPAVDKPAEQPEPRKIKLKVRHQELELSEDEVIAHAQKALAADGYIDDAKRILEDARRTTSSRPHQDEQGSDTDADNQDQPPRQPHQDGPDIFEELVEKVQYGDKAEAAAALRDTLSKMVTQTAAQAAAEATWNDRLQADLARDLQAYKEFQEANAELAKDENAVAVIRANLMAGYKNDLVKIGVPEDKIPKDPEELARHHRFYKLKGQPVRSVSTLLHESKDRFLQWKGNSPAPRPSPASTPSGDKPAVQLTRAERREAIPHQPSRAAVPPQMQRPSAPPPAAGDRSAVIARMRQARGQV